MKQYKNCIHWEIYGAVVSISGHKNPANASILCPCLGYILVWHFEYLPSKCSANIVSDKVSLFLVFFSRPGCHCRLLCCTPQCLYTNGNVARFSSWADSSLVLCDRWCRFLWFMYHPCCVFVHDLIRTVSNHIVYGVSLKCSSLSVSEWKWSVSGGEV